MIHVMLMDTQGSVWVATSHLVVCYTEVENSSINDTGLHLRAPGCGCLDGAADFFVEG